MVENSRGGIKTSKVILCCLLKGPSLEILGHFYVDKLLRVSDSFVFKIL
jgi:hypothetical protein